MLAALLMLLAVLNTPISTTSYACDGVTATYTVNFPYLAPTDLVVTSTTAGAVSTTLVQTTDWTVNVTRTSSTATLTLLSPATKCPSGSTLKISRSTSKTQPYGFRSQTNYNQSLHEDAYDRIAMQVTELNNSAPSTFVGLVSIKDFGGVSDGVTDSTSAYNQAKALAGTSSGVLLPCPGSYKISGKVIACGLTVLQSGTGATLQTIELAERRVMSLQDFAVPAGSACAGGDDTTALVNASAAAVAAGRSLLIDCKVKVASAAGTISATLNFEGNGAIDTTSASGSVTLTGAFIAPLKQIFFTGSGTLTWQAKVAPVVPQWWGAVGDDVNDDGPAIQSALTAAAGDEMYLPTGTYRVNTGPLVIPDGTIVRMAGRDAKIDFRGSGSAFEIRNSKYLALYDMKVDMTNAGASAIALRVRGAWFLQVYKPRIIGGNASQTGIQLETSNTGGDNWGAYVIEVHNPGCDGTGGYCVRTLQTAGDSVLVTHLETHGGWSKGWTYGDYFRNIDGFIIHGLVVDTGTDGYNIDSSFDGLIIPGELGPNTGYGINWGASNQAMKLIISNKSGVGGTLGYQNNTSYTPEFWDQGVLRVYGSRSDQGYYAEFKSIFSYGESFDLTLKGGGGSTKVMKWGDGAGLTIGDSSAPRPITMDLGAQALTLQSTAASTRTGLRNANTRNITRSSSVAAVDCAAAAINATVTQLLDGAIFTCATAQTLTLPTWQGASGTVQALPGTPAVGDVIQFTMNSTAAANFTLAGGTGGTIVGNAVINNAGRVWTCRLTNVGSGTEAASCY